MKQIRKPKWRRNSWRTDNGTDKVQPHECQCEHKHEGLRNIFIRRHYRTLPWDAYFE